MGVARHIRGKDEGTRMLAIMPLHLHVVEMPLMQLFKMLSKQEQMAGLDGLL